MSAAAEGPWVLGGASLEGRGPSPCPYPSQPSANVRVLGTHTTPTVTSRSRVRGPEQDLGICVSICAARTPTELLDLPSIWKAAPGGWGGAELGRPHGEPGRVNRSLGARSGLAFWGTPLSPQLWEQGGLLD